MFNKILTVFALTLAFAFGPSTTAFAAQVALFSSADGSCQGMWRGYRTEGDQHRISGSGKPVQVDFDGTTLHYDQGGNIFTGSVVQPDAARLAAAMEFFARFHFEKVKWNTVLANALRDPRLITVKTDQDQARHEFFLRHDQGFFIAVFVEGDPDQTRPRYWMMLAKGGCHPVLGSTRSAQLGG